MRFTYKYARDWFDLIFYSRKMEQLKKIRINLLKTIITELQEKIDNPKNYYDKMDILENTKKLEKFENNLKYLINW